MDEVALSDGELYTVLTNAESRCQKGSLIAMIKGVKSDNVVEILNKIPNYKRDRVKEVSLDMANSMENIAKRSFVKAELVTDRFHVAQMISDAVQEIRIKYRWEAIDNENEAIDKSRKERRVYKPYYHENGDTDKQLLARSRYLLFKSQSKWTHSQIIRAKILFAKYPQIEKAYELSMMFRNIYENTQNKEEAQIKYLKWKEKVEKYKFKSFITADNSVQRHKDSIFNYFNNKTTNALAETFNSKIKAFRAIFRGVKDIKFFLYRVSLIFA